MHKDMVNVENDVVGTYLPTYLPMISMLKDSYERGDKSLIKRSKRLIGKKKQQSFAGDGRIENWGGARTDAQRDGRQKEDERKTDRGRQERARETEA